MRASNVLVLIALALCVACGGASATDVVDDADNVTVVGQLNGEVTEVTAVGYACIASNASINVTNASFTEEAIAVYSTGNASYIVFDDAPYLNTSNVTNITSYCTNFTAAGNYSTALILAAPVVTTGGSTTGSPSDSSSSVVISALAIVGIVLGIVLLMAVAGVIVVFSRRADAAAARGGFSPLQEGAEAGLSPRTARKRGGR